MSQPPIARPLLVLVVDDESMIRDAIIRILESDGHEACWAATGAGAIALMHSEMPDVVVLDLLLQPGGQDGWSVLREKTLDEKIRGIPVIILTGLDTGEVHAGAQSVDRALSGAITILGKPIDLPRFRHFIEMIASGSLRSPDV